MFPVGDWLWDCSGLFVYQRKTLRPQPAIIPALSLRNFGSIIFQARLDCAGRMMLKGLICLTTQRKMKRSVKFFLTFHRRTPSFSASVSTLPNPQGEYVLFSVDDCVVQMTATHAPEFRLRPAILAVCRSTAVAALTGVMRRHLVNRRFASKRLFQFVPAGFQY